MSSVALTVSKPLAAGCCCAGDTGMAVVAGLIGAGARPGAPAPPLDAGDEAKAAEEAEEAEAEAEAAGRFRYTASGEPAYNAEWE
jgi:hypothetical protein